MAAQSNSYVVAPNGNDQQNGSESRPWRTIQHAIDQAQAGDTILVRSGVYHEVLSITKSGSAEAPIRITAYPREQPILDGNVSGTTAEYELPLGDPDTCGVFEPIRCYVYTALVTIDGSHIQFSGFDIRNSRGMGIRIGLKDTPDDVTVDQCNIYSIRQRGVLIENASNVTLDRCNVHDTANFAPYNRSTSDVNWPGIVHIKSSKNVTLQNSRVYRNWGEGVIAGRDSSSIRLLNNEIFDNFALQIYIHHAENVEVKNNLIYHSNDPLYYRGADPSSCIVLNSETNFPESNGINQVKIINNMVVGCRHNISIWASSDDTISFPVYHVTIAHNTLINAHANSVTPLGIAISPKADLKNIVVANNIIYQASGNTSNNQSGLPSVTFSHNLWYPQKPSGISETAPLIADPLMVAPNSGLLAGCVLPSWYKISAESPARNAAIPQSDVGVDFFGSKRDANPDIGAHEYGVVGMSILTRSIGSFATFLPLTLSSNCQL